jgi:glycosyltransferase involved in cell wall biosynthesis
MSPERRLRVVHLVHLLGWGGGGERFAARLVSALDPDRFDRWLCVTRWDGEGGAGPGAEAELALLRSSGVEFVGLRRRSKLDVLAWRPLVELIRRERIDVVHAHMFGANVSGVVLGRLARVPVVVAHEQTWTYEGRPVRRILDRELIARFSDAFIAVSSEDRRRMIEVEGISPDDIVLVPNAVPPSEPASGRDVRADLGIPGDAPVVGLVAMLRPQKAVEVLVEAAGIMRERFPDIRVLLVGDSETNRPSIEARIAALGLGDTVTILGQREDVADLIAAFDVATLCSDYEGTPLALLEYMDAARPIVATRVGGIPDLVDDGVEAVLVPPRDPKALADAIAGMLADRERAAAFGERARQRRCSEFTIEATAERVGELYRELLERSGRR